MVYEAPLLIEACQESIDCILMKFLHIIARIPGCVAGNILQLEMGVHYLEAQAWAAAFYTWLCCFLSLIRLIIFSCLRGKLRLSPWIKLNLSSSSREFRQRSEVINTVAISGFEK